MKFLKTTKKKFALRGLSVAAAFIAMMSNIITASAAIGDSRIATGLTQLISDATTWLIGLSSGLAGLLLIVFLVQKKMADEQEASKYNKKIKTLLVCYACVLLASVIVGIINNYFGA